jgi:hypothetical protein
MGDGSPSILNVYVVSLSKLQSRLLSLLAGKRSPDSYVAGGIAINRDGPRFSADIDIFQDDVEQLVAIAESDAATIIEAGFVLTWLSSRGSSILAHFNPTEPLTEAETAAIYAPKEVLNKVAEVKEKYGRPTLRV